jgi:hypothetical protein
MNKTNYSSFSRFCYFLFYEPVDSLSPVYQLRHHCGGMSYDELHEFYLRFRKTMKYVDDQDNFFSHLKWLNKGPGTDLTLEMVLADIFDSTNGSLIKETCVSELHLLYKADILKLVKGLSNAAYPGLAAMSRSQTNYDDELPF